MNGGRRVAPLDSDVSHAELAPWRGSPRLPPAAPSSPLECTSTPSIARRAAATGRCLVAAALAAGALALVPAPLAAQSADLILVNGTVLTDDPDDRVAQAVAVRGSRIVAVGSNAEIERLAGAQTRRIDLRGRTVTPGLLDAHAHFSGGYAERLDLLPIPA